MKIKMLETVRPDFPFFLVGVPLDTILIYTYLRRSVRSYQEQERRGLRDMQEWAKTGREAGRV